MIKRASFMISTTVILLTLILPCHAVAQTIIGPSSTTSPQPMITTNPVLTQQPTIKPPLATVNDGQIMNVTSPTGQGMFLGTTVTIVWEWPGYVNRPADVTLWDEVTQPGNPRQVGTIDNGRTALRTAWAIPYTFPPGYYTIRVASSKNPNNHADYRIKVMNSTITVTSPNSNFALAIGSTYTIWWNYQGKPGPVKIELTNTSGSAPLIIASNVPGGEMGLGKFDWIVPQTLAMTSGYLVRVTSLVSASITGLSQPFSIALPSITITKPNPGDEFLPAVYIPITWRSLGNNFGTMVHITAWAAGSSGTSLDVQCPLNQGIYDQWMPSPLDTTQRFFIRVESTQNRSIAAELATPIKVLPRQYQGSPGGATDATSISK